MSTTEMMIIKEQWQAATDEGNRLDNQHLPNEAEASFMQAMTFGILLLDHIDLMELYQEKVIKAFGISYVNLSNFYLSKGDFKLAGDYLFYQVFRLKALSGDVAVSMKNQELATGNWQQAVLLLYR